MECQLFVSLKNIDVKLTEFQQVDEAVNLTTIFEPLFYDMVKIEMIRMDDAYHMAATNDRGNILHLDNGVEGGGKGAGFGPMQSLLSALGGCSVIDVVSILKKQRQELKDIKVTITGEREKGVTPSLYQQAHVHFRLFGDIDMGKAEKAVALSIDKYCSVAETLRRAGAKVTYAFEIIK